MRRLIAEPNMTVTAAAERTTACAQVPRRKSQPKPK